MYSKHLSSDINKELSDKLSFVNGGRTLTFFQSALVVSTFGADYAIDF